MAFFGGGAREGGQITAAFAQLTAHLRALVGHRWAYGTGACWSGSCGDCMEGPAWPDVAGTYSLTVTGNASQIYDLALPLCSR